MKGKQARVIRGDNTDARLTAHKLDAPLHALFPITLLNGKSVPGVHVVCNTCGNSLSGDRVRGRVIQSLPHVVTIEATGLCKPCERLTHIDCRLRDNGDKTLIEWRSSSGLWYSREYRQPTFVEKVTKQLRRFLSR